MPDLVGKDLDLMRQVVIENPIINSPFDEPTRHFRFADGGITNEVVAGRRISSYFVPIAQARKKGWPRQSPGWLRQSS